MFTHMVHTNPCMNLNIHIYNHQANCPLYLCSDVWSWNLQKMMVVLDTGSRSTVNFTNFPNAAPRCCCYYEVVWPPFPSRSSNELALSYPQLQEPLHLHALPFLHFRPSIFQSVIVYFTQYKFFSTSIFMDFSKAFDTVPRDALLYKLLKMGIRGTICKNIEEYIW